jgi:prevent-host-death family protein
MQKIQANMHEAKTHLSQLVTEALAGKEVWISKAGVPQVKLTPITPAKKPGLGRLRGKAIIPDEAFGPMSDEELQEWE